MKLGDFDAIQVVGALVDGDRAFAIAQFSLRAIGPISFFTSSLSPLRKRNCTHCPEEIPVVPLTFTVKSPRLAFSVTEASLGELPALFGPLVCLIANSIGDELRLLILVGRLGVSMIRRVLSGPSPLITKLPP